MNGRSLLSVLVPLTFLVTPATATPILHPQATDWVSLHVGLDGPCVLESLDLQKPFNDPYNIALSSRRLRSLEEQQRIATLQIEALGGEVVARISRLANALQVRIPADRATRIAHLPGVVSVEPAPMYTRNLTSAVPFVGAPQGWEFLPGTGAGIRIGIVDTGIDYLHAAFGGSGDPADYKANDRNVIEPGTFPTAKVAGGWDFVGDDYNGYNAPQPDPDPLDCFEEESTGIAGGHGTHVAGIAAGFGVNLDGTTFTDSYLASLSPSMFRIFPGVAPEATLYALKVFGCDGGTNMVSPAIEWAVDPNGDGDLSDRLDVLNLSLGGSYGLQSQVEAQIVKNATVAGMLLVVAAGNDGDTFFVTGEPSTYTETLSVAATVDELSSLAMRIDSPAAVAGDIPCAEGSFSQPLSVSGPVTGVLAPTVPERACNTLQNPQDLEGNIAFIQRGDCYFVDKVQRAVDAGAIAVVIADNIEQDQPFRMGGDGSQKPIPAVLIRRLDALPLAPYLDQGVTVTLDASLLYPSAIPPDQMASFTSRGPRSWDGFLKPDVAAPGMAILSAGVGSGTDPRETSGTSMACPMAAGAAAILRQVHPTLSAFDIKAMMMNTTAPLANAQGIPVPISLGGAGRIRVFDAASQTVTAAAATPEGAVSISFGMVMTAEIHSETREVIVSNHGNTEATFDVSSMPTFPLEGASLTVTPSSITVPPMGSANLFATLTVVPDDLPLQAPDPHTPGVIVVRDESFARHFLTEFAGHVVLTGTEPAPLRVPFHAILRAVDQRKAGTAARCILGEDPPITVPITGPTTHKEPVVSVFQHVFSHPLSILTNPQSDLWEIGIAHDLATNSFENASLYFAVTVEGDWTTPAKGPLSAVGVAIDTTGNLSEDYVVYVEPFSTLRFRDVLRAVTYRRNGQRVGRTYLNAAARDELNTEPFFSNVVVLPVELSALSELTEDNAAISFYAFTHYNTIPMVREKSDWISYDPTRAPIDTARAGFKGRPLYEPNNPIRVFLNEEFIDDQDPPSLLLLHHSNEEGKRVEVAKLGDVGAVFPSDLTVSQQGPSRIDAFETDTWTVEISNVAGGEARNVKLAISVIGDAKVESLDAEQGECYLSTCTFDALSVGEKRGVDVHIGAGGTDFELVAVVDDAADCEMDPTNNEARMMVEVVAPDGGAGTGGVGGAGGAGGASGAGGAGGTGGTGGGTQFDGGMTAVPEDFLAGGGCSCRTGLSPRAALWPWWMGLGLWFAIRRRQT